MYPSPDLDLTIATATQRERISRQWRRKPLPSARSAAATAAARRAS